MQRRTFYQHPARHSNSDVAPKSQRSASLQLTEFIRDRYDLDEDTEIEKNTSSNDDMPDEDEQEQEEEKEEEEDNTDDEISNQDGDISGDSQHELTSQQQEAMNTLSNVFRMLNMRSIHDQ